MPEKKLHKEQKVQEDKYSFPYHHVITISKNHFSQNFNIKWGYEYASYISFIVDKLKSLSFDSLIDVGCGDGKFLSELDKRIPGKILSGVDYSRRAIGLAKIVSPGIDYTYGDISAEETIKNIFDAATLIETLEHIHPNKINAFISSIARILKKDGLLIVSVPSIIEKPDSHHFQHFDENKLINYFSKHFKCNEIHYINKSSKNVERLSKIFTNKYFILNNKRMKNHLYNYYLKKFLLAKKSNGRRIVAIFRKK